MSAPLVFSTATKGAPAEVSTSVPKGSPVDSRLGSTDFAALLSAGVAAAADEKRPPLGGATVSLGQAAALAAGAPSPLPGRGQRRNDDRDRGGPQHAVVPTPAAAVPPAGVLPPTWLHDGERPMDASEPSASSPGLQPGGESFGGERQAGTDTPAPATAGAPALEAPPVRTQARAPAREAAVSLAGLGVPTITAARARPLVLPVNVPVPVPVPEIAAERALPESGQSIASLPSGTSTGTGTRTGETNTRLRPSSLASPIPTPTTATTAIPIVIETPTATPTAFTSRRVPGEAFAPAFPAAALSPRSAAAAPISQVRMPIPHASAATAVESPGAEDRVVAAPESPAPVGVLALPVVTPTAAPHAGAGRIDVMAI
ncbi:MAG TPA: hypothetical protein VN894_06270, partial [Polyangiaceae bacterium]|nr:hypothetical protein [Polyangiaceae bacterium]